MEVNINDIAEIQGRLSRGLVGFGRTVGVLIELELMKAANEERRSKGLADAYGDDAFAVLLETQSNIVAEMKP